MNFPPRYVEFDGQRPLLQGNVAHLVDAHGNIFPAPYSTLPVSELKSAKSWTKPLPKPGESNRKSGVIPENHVYDCPQ